MITLDDMNSEDTASLLEALGGETGIREWVECFYDKVAVHVLLGSLFPKDLTATRERQYAYFVEFFGGAQLYSERYGRPFLRYRHRHVRIGIPEYDAWLELIMAALREQGASELLCERVRQRIAPLAKAMINHHPEKKDAYYFQ